jgi:hypothetical protein
MKTTVYLSCSKDSPHLLPVKNRLLLLCNQKIEFSVFNHIIASEDRSKEVSKLINRCDIFIPIIDAAWFESLELRDELVQAYERRRYIFPIIFADEVGHNLRKLPLFAQNKGASIKTNHDNSDVVFESIAEYLLGFTDDWNNKFFEKIREIGDTIKPDQLGKLQNRQKEYAIQELKVLRENLSQLFENDGNSYEKNVSYESNFLTQASPFFKCASVIYAVSLVKISSFWTSEAMRDAVISYLRKQSDGNKPVYRLFVFESPEQANHYKNVLEANYSHYGKVNGGIFICSYDTYKNTLRAFDSDLSTDFGILVDRDCEGNTVYFEALVDTKKFTIRKFDLKNHIRFQQFIQSLEEWSLLREGEINDLKVLKWSPKFLDKKTPTEWTNALSKVFSHWEHEVTHIVLLKANDSNKAEVYAKLLDVKERFSQYSNDYKINSIKALSHVRVSELDARFGGKLHMTHKFDFILIETFSNIPNLKTYYAHERHSEQRQILYEILNPEVKSLFEDMKKEKDEEIVLVMYEKIEQAMKAYFWRLDFIDNTPIEVIAQQKGSEFEKFKF